MIERNTIVCIGCPKGCQVKVENDKSEILSIKGFECIRGREYAKKEFTNPTRILPTTVRIKKGELPLIPVKTSAPIPKELLISAMEELAQIEVEAPIRLGDVIVKDLLKTGIDVVATRTIERY